MGKLIADKFAAWQEECEQRFQKLKANEEELNRIFIDIYGLQDELTPEVEDKDVTVRKADLQRDIKSLLSYAVGCMFGRYSLDVEGLAYAGGEWDSSKYQSYIPDEDNVIPITDEEYLDDDIVSRLCAWLKAVYGADTLEENLDYIAKALGNKGSTSREIIRNYFLNDFFRITARLTLSLVLASVRSTGCLTAANRMALRHWFICTATRRTPSATYVSTTCTRCNAYMNLRSTGCRI